MIINYSQNYKCLYFVFGYSQQPSPFLDSIGNRETASGNAMGDIYFCLVTLACFLPSYVST